MRKSKLKPVVIFFLFVSLQINIQAQKVYSILDVGDTLPSILVSIISQKGNKIQELSSFHKGKLLILDFFATWCTPCMKALPKLDSLARVYKNKLDIIAVTSESKSTLFKYFQGKGHRSTRALTYIAGDSLLYRLFPHRIIPHAVWIDSTGKMIAATTDDEINDQKLKSVFQTGAYSGYRKSDNTTFNIDLGLGIGNNSVPDSNIVFRTILTKEIPGMYSGAKRFKNSQGKVIRFTIVNLSLIHMYSFAFSHAQYATLNFNRMILDLKDSASYLPYAILRKYGGLRARSDSIEYDRQWDMNHLYCFDIAVPANKSDSLFNIMFDQLNHISSLKGRVIIESRPCWIIILKDTYQPMISHSPRQWILNVDTLQGIRDIKISEVVEFINQIQGIVPVFDETGWNEPIDMDLHLAHHDKQSISLTDLRKALAPYHLDVKEEQRKLPVLLLSDH